MELLTVNPIRILAQGLTDSKNEFKNIEFDLPFFEMKQLQKSVESFQLEQKDYNSAEIYNKEKRKLFGVVRSYSIREFLNFYQTKRFKIYKMEQIVSVSEYLLKVLKLLDIVSTALIRIEKDKKSISRSKEFQNEKEKEFVKGKMVVAKLFELFAQIILMITDLQTDPNSIDLDSILEDMKEYIRLPLSLHYVPDELVPKIAVVFPGVPLAKFSELEKTRGKSILPKAWNDFEQIEEKLYRVIFLFVDNMINQFSYYVTPELFLNNPRGETIFVIPMSMYKMFNFNNSGLYRKEIVKYGEVSKVEINKKNLDFFSTVKNAFSKIRDEAELVKDEILKTTDDYDAIEFLNAYCKNYPAEKTEKTRQFLSNPVVNERVTAMMISNRKYMMDAAKANSDGVWFAVQESTTEIKDLEKDTLFFLLKVYALYPCGIDRFPQAEIWRIFNLFSYAKQISKVMNWHVNNFDKGNYKISNQYESKFATLLAA